MDTLELGISLNYDKEQKLYKIVYDEPWEWLQDVDKPLAPRYSRKKAKARF